jgi:hypothetical protein
MKKKYLFMITTTLFMYGCGGDSAREHVEVDLRGTSDATEEELLPPGDGYEEIGLETGYLFATAEAANFTIKTKNNGWWVSSCHFINDGDTVVEANQIVTIPEQDGVSDLKILPDTFRRHWLEAAKTEDGFLLHVRLEENSSGKKREALISLSGPLRIGGGELHITQEAK